MSTVSDEYGTPPMFDMPPRYRAPVYARDTPLWRRYRGKRMSCDDCIVALSRDETEFAAMPATNVRTEDGLARYLCSRHTADRKRRDGL